MIEGTKPYRSRNNALAETPKPADPTATASVEAPRDATPPSTTGDSLASPSRREWFQSLVPAFGNGLVEILRASNNLKRDIQDAARDRK